MNILRFYTHAELWGKQVQTKLNTPLHQERFKWKNTLKEKQIKTMKEH